MKNYYAWIRNLLRKEIVSQLKKHSYVHVEEFTRPYIIQKNIEGVDFLFFIRDLHAKLWYDLYATDPVWIEMRFIRDNLVRSGDIVIPKIKMAEPLRTECQHFLDCISDGEKPRRCGTTGMNVIKILEAADVSINNSATHEVIQW